MLVPMGQTHGYCDKFGLQTCIIRYENCKIRLIQLTKEEEIPPKDQEIMNDTKELGVSKF